MATDRVPTVETRSAGSSQTDSYSLLDTALLSMGLAVRGPEVEAYVKDELYRGGSSPDAVVRRVLEGRRARPGRDPQELERLVMSLWHRIKKDYDPGRDRTAGRYRFQALWILDGNLRWLRRLDQRGVDPDALEPQLGLLLARLMAVVTQILVTLNRGDTRELEKSTNLDRLLEAMAAASYRIREAIEKRMLELRPELEGQLAETVH
jgi:hypothetical protein